MHVLASVMSAAPDINSDGIDAGVKNTIPIVLLFIGIAIIAGARKGQMSQNAMTITNVILGLVVIAGAALLLQARGQHRELRLRRGDACAGRPGERPNEMNMAVVNTSRNA